MNEEDKTGLKAMRDAFAKDLEGIGGHLGKLGRRIAEQLAKDAGDTVDDNPDEAREAYYYEIELKEEEVSRG